MPHSDPGTPSSSPTEMIERGAHRFVQDLGVSSVKPRIFVIEGIPGSGKSTFFAALQKLFAAHHVHAFDENSILLGWVHSGLSDEINDMRLDLWNMIADHMGRVLKDDPEAIFVFDRGHISIGYRLKNDRQREAYERLLARLGDLPLLTVMLTVEEDELEQRVSHLERDDRSWYQFIANQVRRSEYDTLRAYYAARQAQMVAMAKEQQARFGIDVALPFAEARAPLT